MDIVLVVGVVLVLLLHKHSAFVLGFLDDMFPIVGKTAKVVAACIDAGTATVEKAAALLKKATALLTPILAALWVMSIGLTLTDWLTPLKMASPYLRSAAHCGIWLLVFPAARQFNWPVKWPRRLWQGSVLLAAGACLLTFVYIGFALLYAGAVFFGPIARWQTTYVYFQRGNTVVADQRHAIALGGAKARRVVLYPVTPLLQWVELPPYQATTPPAAPPGAGWVMVNKKAADFSFDPFTQHALNKAREIERQCWADRRRIDSLAIKGQLPLEARTLPATTRHGANTIGCLAGGEVWRNYLILPSPGECRQAGAVGIVRKLQFGQESVAFSLSAIMRVGNIYRYITLRLPELHGPGVYTLTNDRYETNSPEAAHLMLTKQTTVNYSTTKEDFITTKHFPGTVTITRFDTLARVVSGTFEGSIYDVSNKVGPLLITQGRFDVNYQE